MAAAGEFLRNRPLYDIPQIRSQRLAQILDQLVGRARQNRRDGLPQAVLEHQVDMLLHGAEDGLFQLLGLQGSGPGL